MMSLLCDPSVKVINYLDSSLRVETLSFQEAADFNPQEWFIWFMTFSLGWRILL
jgi:hypothetical protein